MEQEQKLRMEPMKDLKRTARMNTKAPAQATLAGYRLKEAECFSRQDIEAG